MKNSIFVIKPYKWNGMWVFDDERVGLDKEPFVAGADTMIDTAVQLKGIPNAPNGQRGEVEPEGQEEGESRPHTCPRT
jgi:hypothetical protein